MVRVEAEQLFSRSEMESNWKGDFVLTDDKCEAVAGAVWSACRIGIGYLIGSCVSNAQMSIEAIMIDFVLKTHTHYGEFRNRNRLIFIVARF